VTALMQYLGVLLLVLIGGAATWILFARALDAGRLFDMPIRRDPAARRPLFELITQGER